MPFWSYRELFSSNWYILVEVILNVLLFIPIGALYRTAVRYPKWWILLTLAAVFSMSIELMQYILDCGTVEIDDVLHNSLGAIIGYSIALLIGRASTHPSEEN